MTEYLTELDTKIMFG